MGVMMAATIDEVCILLGRLTVVAHQILDDVDSAVKTNDLELFLDRMVANAEDLQAALTTSPQQVAQNPLHTNERKQHE
jgi:hypothetical protein